MLRVPSSPKLLNELLLLLATPCSRQACYDWQVLALVAALT